jgi:hypothetical protein
MNNKLIAAALVVQTVSLALFCYQFLGTLIASPALKITWRIHEMIEITSIVGLVVGACMTLYALRASLKRTKRVEEQLAIASASFHQMMLAKFDDWALSDAEREVATMIIKGSRLPRSLRCATHRKGRSRRKTRRFIKNQACRGGCSW